MPHHVSSKKRIRQDKKRAEHNRFYKVKAKRAMKEVQAATTVEEAEEKFRFATKVLDKIACRGIVKKNYASNKKAKLAKFINTMKAAQQA